MSDEQAELAAAHARIAALEARQAQAVEMLEVVLGATLPYQDESGVIRVKLHPFGKIRNAATLLSSAPAETQSNPTPAPAEDVVQRVGRAIYVSMGLGDAWDSAPECVRDKWKVHARAALSALPLDRELQPDMFWDCNNPEQPFDSVQNLLFEMDYDGEGVVEVQQAVHCPNAAYHYRFAAVEDTDDREVSIQKLTDDQYREMVACRKVGFALRAMWAVKVERLASEHFEANKADLGYGEKHEFRHATISDRRRLEKDARAFLLQQIGNLGDENGD